VALAVIVSSVASEVDGDRLAEMRPGPASPAMPRIFPSRPATGAWPRKLGQLAVAEHRRRLVEHDQPRLPGQGAGDLDHLAPGHAQAAARRPRGQVEAQLARQTCSPAFLARPTADTVTGRRW
jgi:hypothetical protein